MIQRFFAICLLFVYPDISFSNHYQDSIREMLIQHQAIDEMRIDMLNELCFQTWSFDPDEAKKYAEQAMKLSDSLGSDKGKAYSTLALGMGYWGQENFNVAMEYFLKAENMAKELNDSNIICTFKYHIAMAYLGEAIVDLANKNFRIIIPYFRKTDNEFMLARCYSGVSRSYLFTKSSRKDMRALDSAELYWTALGNDYELIQIQLMRGIVYLYLDKKQKAVPLLNAAVSGFNKFEDKLGLVLAQKEAGNAYMKIGDLDSAEVFFLDALNGAKKLQNLDQQYEINHALHEIELTRGNHEKALAYYKEHIATFDKKVNRQISYQVHEMKMKYDSEKAENEITLLNQERKIQNTYLIGLSILIIVISIAATLITLSFRNGRRKDKLLHDSKQALMLAEISNAKLKEKELQMELESKNMQLTSYTKNFVQKGVLLKELEEKLDQLNDGQNEKLASGIRELKLTLSQHLSSDSDWEDFKIHFESVHPSFISALKKKNPDIGNADIRLCTLLKLNLNSKQIADVMAISPDSVKTARHRLRTKLNLSRDQNLIDFIRKIEAEELVKDT